MKLRGGYNVALEGWPSGKVEVLGEPEKLLLPLQSQRFAFTDIRVSEGQSVQPGQVLARDTDNYSVPLLAPRAGTARLSAAEGHIVLEQLAHSHEGPYASGEEEVPHVSRNMGSSGMKRYKLLSLGAWQFLYEAYTGDLPDPFGVPQGVIVSGLHLEPFVARGDVQLHKRLGSFTRGLEHLQSLLEYQPIYLVLPDIRSEFALQVREAIRGYAWVKLIQVPLRYPYDHFTVLARALGFKHQEDSPVWAMRVEGVLAIDRALTLSRSCSVRIISLGGPGVDRPIHLKALPGYPIQAILEGRLSGQSNRIISGGVLTGQIIPQDQMGLDTECCGLTVLAEQSDREMLGFVRPGWSRRSYSSCFLSSLRGQFQERLTTGLRGEGRPCIACGSCEEVCPVSIMPYLIHKYLYQDELEEAELARVDRCVACGLCSFVCPSKIELSRELVDAQERIRQELHAEVEEVDT